MATTVEPRDGTQPYVDADEYIDFQLAKTQSQIKATEIFTAASWLGLAVLGYTLTFVVLDQWLIPGGFGTWARAIWLGILLVGGGAWLAVRILSPSFRTVHELYAAKMIESADPTLKSSLLNLIDLQLDGRKSQSALVRSSMEKRAAVELSRVDVDHAIDRQALLRVAYALLAMVVVCCLYVMLSPKDAFSSVQRLLLPASQTAVATRTTIANLTPEDTRVLAGEILTVEADILGQMPSQVTLLFTTADHEFVNQPVQMERVEEGTSRFRGVINGEKGRGLMQNITYRLEAGDARTRDYEVQVSEPPSSRVASVSYTFPAYMKLDPRKRTGGHIDAWEGTKLALSATTTLPVQSAMLVMTDTDDPLAKGEEIRMKITNGKTLSADWTLEFRSDGTFARYYHIECTTAAGESDPRPTVYSIKIKPDLRPDVALLHPTQDLERPANAIVPLSVKAADPDFQLRFVTLRVEKAGEEILSASLSDEERPTFEGTYDLKLEKMSAAGLQPGDEILYWIEARDNKHPHGNRSATPRLKIKIAAPAKADQLAQQLDQDRQKLQQQADAANEDRNPLDPDRQPPEAGEEKEPRAASPRPKQPERKPGDPKPRENARQLNEPQDKPEDRPNDPQPQDDKAEAEQQPGKKANGQPQPGKNAQQQRQPGDKPAGDKQEGNKPSGEEGAAGEQNGEGGEKSASDQQGKPGDKSGADAKSSNQPGDRSRQNQNKKRGPADDQTALQELINRQQQKPESNPEESETGADSGNNSNGNKPAEGDPQSADKKTPGQQPPPDNGQRGKNQTNGNEKQPKSDQSNPGQGPGQKKGPSDQPNGPMPEQEPMPGERGANPPQSDEKQGAGKKAPGEKSDSSPQGRKSQPGQESKPNPDGKPQPGAEENPDPQSPKTGPGQGKANDKGQKPDPGAKPMSPPEGQNGADKGPNGDNESPDGANGEAMKDRPDAKAGKNSAGEKPGEKNAPQGTKPESADDQAGDGMTAPGDEKSGGQKQPGAANKPTNEQGPDNGMPPEQGPGNGQRPDPKRSPGAEAKPSADKSADKPAGEETPAEAGPDAQKRDANGKEVGPAEGQDKPEGDAPRAENALDRKPGRKPGAMRESDDPKSPDAKRENGAKAPSKTRAKPDGTGRPDEPMNGAGKDPSQTAEKRPGTDPSQNQPNPGPGRPNQKSQQPDSGEAGGGTPQDQGTPGSKQEGAGDTQSKPGQQTPDTQKQGGEPGDKAGPGPKSQPSKSGGKDQQPGGDERSSDKPEGQPMPADSGMPTDDGKSPDGGAQPDQGGKPGQPREGKPGEGKPGQGTPNGKAGQGGQPSAPGAGANNPNSDDQQPGNPQGNGQGRPDKDRRNLPPAEQDQAAQEAAEKANEEFARKASSLVLKKLRKDLDRGEVDQQLLDDLGWKKDDMERFVQRLEKQLADKGDDTSPESIARRRQFEETLKTLGLSSKTKLRKAIGGKPTRVNELGDRKIAPPPEYQELFEEYTKDLAKPTTKK